jgi:hypothetical protein
MRLLQRPCAGKMNVLWYAVPKASKSECDERMKPQVTTREKSMRKEWLANQDESEGRTEMGPSQSIIVTAGFDSAYLPSHHTAYLLFHGTDSRMQFDIIAHPLKFDTRHTGNYHCRSVSTHIPLSDRMLWPALIAKAMHTHALCNKRLFPSSYSHVHIFRPRCRAYTPDFHPGTQFYILRPLSGRAKI